MTTPQISEAFTYSRWYADIIFVLLNLQAPPGLSRTKARFFKMKSLKYCIIDNALFWKDNGGILLNCLLKDEADIIMQEFHAGYCGRCCVWSLIIFCIQRYHHIGPQFEMGWQRHP